MPKEFLIKMPDYWAEAKKYIRNAIYLQTHEAEAIPVGASKLGGEPDLPASMDWCTRKNGRPLSFLAQLNLGEIHEHDVAEELPAEGMLYFFYDASNEPGGTPWGYDPADGDGWQVIYYGEGQPLARRAAPEYIIQGGFQFGEAALSFSHRRETPYLESDLLRDADIPEADRQVFYTMLDANHAPGTKMLGHSSLIQEGMELEVESVTSGIYMGDGAEGVTDPARAKKWRLLFQLDSADRLDMMWGDEGMLYFWMREEDIRARAFDKCWMILQCS